MKLVRLSIAFCLLFVATACQLDAEATHHPRATIEGGNPPKFIVSGGGTLDSIAVSGPDMKRQTPEGQAPYMEDYWMIMPKEKMAVQPLEELGAITYGQVPEGFVQWIPKIGEPSPLSEGGLFHFQLSTKQNGSVSIFFTLREGKIVTAKD